MLDVGFFFVLLLAAVTVVAHLRDACAVVRVPPHLLCFSELRPMCAHRLYRRGSQLVLAKFGVMELTY